MVTSHSDLRDLITPISYDPCVIWFQLFIESLLIIVLNNISEHVGIMLYN